MQDFYRDQVFQVLKTHHATGKTKREMQDILRRFFPQDHDEQETEEIAEDRLEYLLENVGREGVLEELTDAEQESFTSFLKSEACRQTLEKYVPWWEADPLPNYEVLDLTSVTAATYDALPPLRTLSPKPPSPALPYHILNALWAIAYTWRLYNGDTDTSGPLMRAHAVAISDALSGKADASMATSSLAISKAQERAISLDQTTSRPLIPVIQTDLKLIISSKSLCIESFFQLQSLANPGSSLYRKTHFYLCYLKFQTFPLVLI